MDAFEYDNVVIDEAQDFLSEEVIYFKDYIELKIREFGAFLIPYIMSMINCSKWNGFYGWWSEKYMIFKNANYLEIGNVVGIYYKLLALR